MAYASSYLKCHHPDVFCAALLNAQPMGFYAPAQIVRDARAHGVDVRAIDINRSRWDCSLEGRPERGRFTVRLGFRLVKGLSNDHAARLIAKVRRTGAQGPVLPCATEFVEGPSQQAAFEMIVEVIETGGQSPSDPGCSMMSFDPCDLLAEQKDRIRIVPFHDVMPPGREDKHEQNRNTS